jgi:hypothetical protein
VRDKLVHHRGEVDVLRYELHLKGDEAHVDVAGHDADRRFRTVLDPRRHIILCHRSHGLVARAVRLRDLDRAEQAALLRGVPVELDRLRGRETNLRKTAERLEDGDGAGAVVVCARGAGLRVSVVLAVLVRAEDDDAVVGGDVRPVYARNLRMRP